MLVVDFGAKTRNRLLLMQWNSKVWDWMRLKAYKCRYSTNKEEYNISCVALAMTAVAGARGITQSKIKSNESTEERETNTNKGNK